MNSTGSFCCVASAGIRFDGVVFKGYLKCMIVSGMLFLVNLYDAY